MTSNGRHARSRRNGWTRKKALALASGVVVAGLGAFGIYDYLPGTAATPPAAAAATQGTTVYYSDGKTVLGTFGQPGQPSQVSDPWAPYLMTQVKNELTGVDGVSQQELAAGGLKVVTTISHPMEAEMYKTVDENLNAASISKTPGATVTSLPAWALVGAELQDPKTGQIIAEYPGKGQDMAAAQCKLADCDANTAAYVRVQAGSSFTPYVLATAVSQGLNVKTSTLNASPELCIPPDTQPTALSAVVPYGTRACAAADDAAVFNLGGEVIGNAEQGGGTTVQNALAQSSDTAFTDLAHRAGTANIAAMARQFGVDVAPSQDGGSGLRSYIGGVGMALGVAPLTVNEQATTLATIADNGLYHQAHLVKSWQRAGGPKQAPKVQARVVLPPGPDAQVQYAMENTTIDGTAAQTVTYGQRARGTVIGQTGTTTESASGSFMGATTQYSLVVSMFTNTPVSSAEKLSVLGGGGFGAYWPAKIWNAFAQAEFAKTPSAFPTSPAFTGADWNQVGS
jgi:membrane peptidoglycan carboxypeptidase